MRIFAHRDGIVRWQWAMDTDFSEATAYKLQADNANIELSEVTDEIDGDEYNYTEVSIPMPEMNGLDATRAIRKLENPGLASVPIVAMTADAFSENITECMNAGMDGHIAKPVDIKLVIKEIRRIRERRFHS